MTSKVSDVQIEASWKDLLAKEFDKPYFLELKAFLRQEKQSGKVIYPPGAQIFSAFNHCPFPNVKVVIIGQDPYHGPGQANGLCFSVAPGVQHPPSLVNIFKELESDIGFTPTANGDLSSWADQGVLLLNATLTVEAGKAGAHQNKGWEVFTDAVIDKLNTQREGLVFMLWGGYAKKKGSKIDQSKHLVLTSGHPSPLSANKGYWFGNKHFSRCNAYLTEQGATPINWPL